MQYLDPNPYFDSDLDQVKNFGFFRIQIRIRIRNTAKNIASRYRYGTGTYTVRQGFMYLFSVGIQIVLDP
jgi:hypothetical protein